MKHYKTPTNKGDVSTMPIKVSQYSTQCVDKIFLGLEVKNNIITQVRFDGEGCAIFFSSSDIMLDSIKNKTLAEAKEIVKEYENLINGRPANQEILKELNIYENISTRLNRLHCASIISDALNKVI